MSKVMCPVLAATILPGYSAGQDWQNVPLILCIREKCAMWTRYGCGYSNNVTEDAVKEATKDE